MNPCARYAFADIQASVTQALKEDIGDKDITAELIPVEQQASAKVITRENCTLAGQDWVDEVFRQLDRVHSYSDNPHGKTSNSPPNPHCATQIHWKVQDGEHVKANSVLFELEGNARTLLTGERTALNYLQLLSGTATICSHYANLVKHTSVKLLDTRKTIPGLRTAQKYAVRCGGCYNHRMGLYDAFLIKENHISACGGIRSAIRQAQKNHPDMPVEVEVEDLEQLAIALDSGANIVMLDNFNLEQMRESVKLREQFKGCETKLEASGGITADALVATAETGIDYISIGSLTKHCQAIDLSMRLLER